MNKETHNSIVVKALCYKLEGRGFETRDPSNRNGTRSIKIMFLGSKAAAGV
jgi:hypothetical protein